MEMRSPSTYGPASHASKRSRCDCTSLRCSALSGARNSGEKSRCTFEAHQATPHFKKYLAEAVPLLASRERQFLAKAAV